MERGPLEPSGGGAIFTFGGTYVIPPMVFSVHYLKFGGGFECRKENLLVVQEIIMV